MTLRREIEDYGTEHTATRLRFRTRSERGRSLFRAAR
jgi:hypothetical protein